LKISFKFFHVGWERMASSKYKCSQNFGLVLGQLITSLEASNFTFHVLNLFLEFYWLG